MSRKTFSLLALLTLLSLVVGAPGTFAQTPQPPERPYPPGSERPTHYPERSAGDGEEAFRNPTEDAGTQSLGPAVELGEPGTSFRYLETFGVTGEPYPADADHLNGPYGLFIDSSDNLFVIADRDFRMLKFNASGANQLIIGHAGQPSHHDDYLAWPEDVAVSNNGHIWITIEHAVKEFDEAGQLVQIFPAENPWEPGTANDRFNDPRGIAIDAVGKLYVSDSNNHRIQVYDISGEIPVYETTIGETGVPHTDNAGFTNPHFIDIDSSNRLYVVEGPNHRVQRCEFSGAWTCSTFVGETGVPGDDLAHLNWPTGVSVDTADSVYIADLFNQRALKCNTAGTCIHFAGTTGEPGSDNAHFNVPLDTAVDSNGYVYVSDWSNQRVQKFDESGIYVATIGVTGEPYLVDDLRLNAPWGIAVDQDGGMYVTENRGFRLVKMDARGEQQWTVGEPGVYGDDAEHFGSWWAGLEGNLAVDSAGLVYVPDTGNNRIQIFDSDGNYLETFGGGGNGNYEFECPAGVAISPVNGDIYMVDRCNQRIQVFTGDRVYKATLGVLDESGSDNQHFNWPWGVTVDADGKIYVADSDNHRVQKCTLSGSSYTCTTFAGETGIFDNAFGHLHPLAVAVDGDRRVYVADEWNYRIQVFDDQGTYLTTIGGGWGAKTGEMVRPSGVAVDGEGNVYVTDRDNHRVQKFALGVQGWIQTNINGFGDPGNTWVSSLEVFNGQFYAGTANWDKGGTIWRSNDGINWTNVNEPGFGDTYGNTNPVIVDMFEFRGNLYATTGWGGAPGQMWRSSNGTDWSQVVADGFGDPANGAITVLEIFKDNLYAATHTPQSNGIEIWRSATGNNLDWTPVVVNGYGDANNVDCTGLIDFDGYLYAAVENNQDGLEVWRSLDGIAWDQVNVNGFGDAKNNHTSNWSVLNGYLYLATRNYSTGGQVWRTSNGTTWEQVQGNGFDDLNNQKIDTLYTYGNQIYAVTENNVTGAEVWKSFNGITWFQANPDGFGDSNNAWTFWSPAIHAFNYNLYIGTTNYANGGEIWKKLSDIYLPVVVR